LKLTRCEICGETLRDPESIKNQIGPVCAKNLTRFLAAVGSSAEEVAALTVMGDGATVRYLRLAHLAVGARRTDQAKRFFESARNAARAFQVEQFKEAAEAA
jgi:hypothetical protein